MSALLEVIALNVADAKAAEAGGANRIELVGAMDEDGLSPEPKLVADVCAATSLPVRCMLRLRGGFVTDGGEFTRLCGLARSYCDAGAEGLVFGFLNGLDEIDDEVCQRLIDQGDWPWTFHRAVDAVLNVAKAWQKLPQFARLDAVLTAGSARGVTHGLDDLIRVARSDAKIRDLIMVGGGLEPEHLPWLARSGIRQFHVGSRARTGGSFQQGVDESLVRTWRIMIDQETHVYSARSMSGSS